MQDIVSILHIPTTFFFLIFFFFCINLRVGGVRERDGPNSLCVVLCLLPNHPPASKSTFASASEPKRLFPASVIVAAVFLSRPAREREKKLGAR